MQTIYTTTSNITSRPSNIVDLAEYRRKRPLAREGSLAPQSRIMDWEPCLEDDEETPMLWEVKSRRSSRRQRRALTLDTWASVGVLVMTLTFTLRVLMV